MSSIFGGGRSTLLQGWQPDLSDRAPTLLISVAYKIMSVVVLVLDSLFAQAMDFMSTLDDPAVLTKLAISSETC